MVMIAIKVKLLKKCREKVVCIKYDVEKLKDPNIADQFKAQIGSNLHHYYFYSM